MADCRVVDGIGNHVTFVFGEGARFLAGAFGEFLAGEPACPAGRPSHGDREDRTMGRDPNLRERMR